MLIRGDAFDVAIDDGVITAVGPELPAERNEVDARGLAILPALIDVHLHFNEPGRTEWEGAFTGSRALAAGGGTVFFDMPLNSTPCVVNAAAFDEKRRAIERASIADFGIWGGLVPGNVGELAELASRGVIGFKAFMCDSGLPDFPRADDGTLLDGMREAARLGLPVAVHAENNEIVSSHPSRPVVAEVEAITRACVIAQEAGAGLHIVHISSGRGVVAAAQAKARGVDVSLETCPHYLHFTDADRERLGTIAKCAPPLRGETDQAELWQQLQAGVIDIVASDHSPATPELKLVDFANAWGGIAGVQSTLSVLIEDAHHRRGISLARIVELLATNPAKRFGLARRGALVVGNVADIVLVDLNAAHTLSASDLQQRHPLSPYLGERMRGIVRRTIRRGETIFLDGRILDASGGQLLTCSI